jgi:hydroxymethylbilane synthase
VPLAAHATWTDDGRLQLVAALGDARDPARRLLRAEAVAPVGDVAAALALGAEAVAALRAAGADDYLDAATADG